MSAVPPGLTAMTTQDLEAVLESRSRALTAAKWIYGPRAWSSVMPSTLLGVSPQAWERVRATRRVAEVHVAEEARAADGTIKLLIAVEGGAVEAVMIPSSTRSTVCVSSQIGCTRSCKFCATATLRFGRNLRADEIVAQYLIARMLAPTHAPAKNVVFMGMG